MKFRILIGTFTFVFISCSGRDENGGATPPTNKVAEDIEMTSVSVTLEATTTYFWKVSVKDNKLGQTHGQAWTCS